MLPGTGSAWTAVAGRSTRPSHMLTPIPLAFGDKPLSAVADHLLRRLPDPVIVVETGDVPPEHLVRSIEQHRACLAACFGESVPLRVTALHSPESVDGSTVWSADRLAALRELGTCGMGAPGDRFIVVAEPGVLDLRAAPVPDPIRLVPGAQHRLDELTTWLAGAGYTRVSYVESPGEFAVRGGIVDLWPDIPPDNQPLRMVLDDDRVSALRTLDTATQRSGTDLPRVNLWAHAVRTDPSCPPVRSLLPPGTLYIRLQADPPADAALARYRRTPRYRGDAVRAAAEYERLLRDGWDIVVACVYEYEMRRVEDLFRTGAHRPRVCEVELAEGLVDEHDRRVVTTYVELFARYEYYESASSRDPRRGMRLEGIWEMHPGELVVHREFGIGRYEGTRTITVGDRTAEYLTILFRDNARIHVPLTELHKVEKYVALTAYTPPLSSLEGGQWRRTLRRIKDTLREFVVALHQLYTARAETAGIAYPPDGELERQLDDTFVFEETEDQLRAIAEVKADMEAPRPMDRIVVGDVGFGKTEVAVRAAFKAVVGGRQVMVLCPTTILAEQHYRTFVDRLGPFGVRVGVLTRLQRRAEASATIRCIADGSVDIAIGTQAVLAERVRFANLGLIIIDEEHKFGVRDKEHLRLRYRDPSGGARELPDVLSLTATPIPRTLSIALQGIKDISVIETPPEGRLPIGTEVRPYDEDAVLAAISRELRRDGQVYYVFNRIPLIEHKTAWLRAHFPSATVEFIHSKLPARRIEEVMLRFIRNEIQVLVTTTIIESGLDMPNVNTIIVEDAEHYGLAQLYQLRGRVGRRTVPARCCLFHGPDPLSADARKRLAAIAEYSALGSGYRLALRDLEIRGAGELIGTRQHGVVREVGLHAYGHLVREILAEMGAARNVVPASVRTIEPAIDLVVDAAFPPQYIPDDETRIGFYRRLLQADSHAQIDRIRAELVDRFGPLSAETHPAVRTLFDVARLRVLLKKHHVVRVAIGDHEPPDCLIKAADAESGRRIHRLLHGVVGGVQLRGHDTMVVLPGLHTPEQIISELLERLT